MPHADDPKSPEKAAPFARLSAEELITLNEEIAGMARAGLPLDQGLAALARDLGRGRLQLVTAGIADGLRSGLTLPEAIERQGGRVPPYYSGLLLAGVRSGRLQDVLATLTLYARTLADLRSTMLGALVYPAMVMVLSLALVGFIFFFIMPQFEQIFEDFKIRLPAMTEVVFWIARHPVELIIIPAGALGLVLGIVIVVAKSSHKGQMALARFVYSLPIVGTLLRSARLAAFTDLLGILVDHQVPLPEALRLASQAVGDPLLRDAAGQAVADLGGGVTLGQTARARALVPDLVAWLIGLGEQRGSLGASLHQAAQMFRHRVEMRAVMLRNVVPPFVVIMTAGLLVTVFVFAVALPMFKLIEGLSGGLSL
ncbi:MAG: type II secretion system F family protein [Planctomycetes bacterium]|nr:type II secretion system F family protein [Planctomycetota bacterium]